MVAQCTRTHTGHNATLLNGKVLVESAEHRTILYITITITFILLNGTLAMLRSTLIYEHYQSTLSNYGGG